MTAPVVIALLVAFGVALVAVMLFQEARTRTQVEPPAYIVSDAIDYARAHVDPEVRSRLKKAGIQRIIEWSVHYLQGLAEKATRRGDVTVIAGGEETAVAYITAQLAKRGFDYSEEDVAAVLATEADYLASIGALGDVADEVELG